MMNIKMKKLFHERNTRIIITIYSLIILFRVFEAVLIMHNYGFELKILASEFYGLLMDIIGVGIFIITYIIIDCYIYTPLHYQGPSSRFREL